MTEDPELVISVDTHTLAAPPRPERVEQPGPTLVAPAHDPARRIEVPDDIVGLIESTRSLFRVARHPRQDAAWPHHRTRLSLARIELRRILARDPDHTVAAEYLAVVETYLGFRA